jgi:glutamate racemase
VLYVADSGYAPYGDRAEDYIRDRADAVLDYLIANGVKAVVVACNTVTGIAVEGLRERVSLPVVAIEPAVKPAVSTTRSGVVGLLATTVTLASPNVQRLLATYGAGARVVPQPCPGWVELVERGELMGVAALEAVARYVRPLVAQGADTLVLGCTHYAFLEPLIRAVAGPATSIVNPAPAVARQLRRRLADAGLLAPGGRAGPHVKWERFVCSGDVAAVERVMSMLWIHPVRLQPMDAATASW